MSRPPRSTFGRMSLLACVLVCAFGVAACAESAADGDRALSKREYIDRANELQVDASKVFAQLDGRLAATPASAKVQLAAFDELITGYEALRPPKDWRDEHADMLEALRTMRQSMLVVSRASARNRQAITVQVGRFQDAQRDYRAAVQGINASR